MANTLFLRLEGVLQAWGERGRWSVRDTAPEPTKSGVIGLVACAMGYKTDAQIRPLAEKTRIGVRCDVPGQIITDYHTADLGQPFLQKGWTTRGVAESRGGGSAATGTHIRYRQYHADASYTVALTLDPVAEYPDLSAVEEALRQPERPLFVGRKTCLPSVPILGGRIAASTLRDALATAPASRWSPGGDRVAEAWWPAAEGGEGMEQTVSDHRDWYNQIHTGKRFICHGHVNVRGGDHDD